MGITTGLGAEELSRLLGELSSLRSPTSRIKMPKLVARDYSTQFASKHMRKDLEIVERAAQKLKVFTPLSALAVQIYRATEGMTHSEEDFSSVLEVYRKSSGRG